MSTIDRLTESVARWTAKRTTRRSFLGNAGRIAVVAAAGSSITAVLANQAHARVCGQSGVSPKCPTYDCLAPGFWGYCWYASPGCCANGGLKKICDCCLAGWPNVQGYCPSGSAVYCIVESCLEDPRVQSVPLDRWVSANPVLAGIERSKVRPSSDVVVIANASQTLASVLAVTVAAELNAPILGIADDALPGEVAAEITRLGAKSVVVAAPGLTPPVLEAISALTTSGITVDNVSPTAAPGDFAGASLEVARWVFARTQRFEVVVTGTDGEAAAIAPAAAAFAKGLRAPILIGADAARAFAAELATKLSITTIGASLHDVFPDAVQFTKGTPADISRALGERVIERDAGSLTLGIAATTSGGFGYVVAMNNIVLVHDPGSLADDLREWIAARRRRFVRAEVCTGAPGAFDNANLYFIQSALNGFDAQHLVGGGGDGLPVYAQPIEEQVIGKARVSGALPPQTGSTLPVRRSRIEDRYPVPTVVMPPPTSWPPGPTTTTLPPASATTLVPPRPASTVARPRTAGPSSPKPNTAVKANVVPKTTGRPTTKKPSKPTQQQ